MRYKVHEEIHAKVENEEGESRKPAPFQTPNLTKNSAKSPLRTVTVGRAAHSPATARATSELLMGWFIA